MFRLQRDGFLQRRFPLLDGLAGIPNIRSMLMFLNPASRKIWNDVSACAALCSRPSTLEQLVVPRLHAETDAIDSDLDEVLPLCVRKHCRDSPRPSIR